MTESNGTPEGPTGVEGEIQRLVIEQEEALALKALEEAKLAQEQETERMRLLRNSEPVIGLCRRFAEWAIKADLPYSSPFDLGDRPSHPPSRFYKRFFGSVRISDYSSSSDETTRETCREGWAEAWMIGSHEYTYWEREIDGSGCTVHAVRHLLVAQSDKVATWEKGWGGVIEEQFLIGGFDLPQLEKDIAAIVVKTRVPW